MLSKFKQIYILFSYITFHKLHLSTIISLLRNIIIRSIMNLITSLIDTLLQLIKIETPHTLNLSFFFIINWFNMISIQQ